MSMNPNYVKEYNKRYYIKNRERKLAKQNEYFIANKDKINARRREHYQKYKEQMRLKSRLWILNKKFNIGLSGYTGLLIAAQNKCEICDREFGNGLTPYVDHCHVNGHIRGVLCNSCNTKLGWYERNKELIDLYLSPKIKQEKNVG